MLLSLVLPLAVRDGLPYVVDEGLEVLVDSGASGTYVARQLLESASSEVGRLARALGAPAVEATSLQLPPTVAGILGFDALGACASFEFDLEDGLALLLDEPSTFAEGRRVATMTASALGAASRPYPTVACAVYGADATIVEGLVDTGSPATIANPALRAAAGLFESEDAAATRGADGALTALRPCAAAGMVFGERQVPSPRILVGDLPQWAALGVDAATPALVVGLDVLGARFRATRAEARRKKTRADAPRGRRKSRATAAAPRAGDAWVLSAPS